MKKINEMFGKILKNAVTKSLEKNANSTTCGVIYQPKVPLDLKKFSKIKND